MTGKRWRGRVVVFGKDEEVGLATQHRTPADVRNRVNRIPSDVMGPSLDGWDDCEKEGGGVRDPGSRYARVAGKAYSSGFEAMGSVTCQ